ncbi:MAG: hypothetical protein KBH99_05570 [Syntrophobacteraceae bacterium]|nr:hypothetical protein [Syntrophobacteraceae bacterium]
MSFPTVREIRFESDRALFLENGFRTYSDFMDPERGTHVARKRGRVVRRLEFEDRRFFLKRNRFHWIEFLKGLLRLRFFPRNGLREWCNIFSVGRAGIPTVRPIAWGEHRFLHREISSFTITEELYGAKPLSEVLLEGTVLRSSREWIEEKRDLIRRLAHLARHLHDFGMYHQDFYLGHIYLGPDKVLSLIDLQRVLHFPAASSRYQIKDLAQLNYSSLEIPGITTADRLRFLLSYLGSSKLGSSERKMIERIRRKTGKIAAHTVKLLERRRRRKEIP